MAALAMAQKRKTARPLPVRQGPRCGDDAMENTFLYPHDKGAEALILLVRELLGLLADDLHTHGLHVQ